MHLLQQTVHGPDTSGQLIKDWERSRSEIFQSTRTCLRTLISNLISASSSCPDHTAQINSNKFLLTSLLIYLLNNYSLVTDKTLIIMLQRS